LVVLSAPEKQLLVDNASIYFMKIKSLILMKNNNLQHTIIYL
jgi:hypothetical protein